LGFEISNENIIVMKFDIDLVPGKLIKRYKRFLADVELEDGTVVTAHCTNSGSMKSCLEEGAPVYLSPVNDPRRKTKFTWEMILINDGWVGINTLIPNKLAYDAIKNDKIPKLSNYTRLQREAKFGNSRIDILAEKDNEKCYIEVKNVTLKDGRFARFPDAITARGKKHLETLIDAKKQGKRAVMLYVIQRMDVELFGLAWDIDPGYAETLIKAYSSGVEIIALKAKVSPTEIAINKEVEFDLTK
jgi:sugar fermentation stimulation protein A